MRWTIRKHRAAQFCGKHARSASAYGLSSSSGVRSMTAPRMINVLQTRICRVKRCHAATGVVMNLLMVLNLSSCATRNPLPGSRKGMDDPLGVTSSLYERGIKHQTDAWNERGLWRRIQENPPSFVPRDMASSVPAETSQGTWHVDALDGWRFFVPHGGTTLYSEGVLHGEAKKVANAKNAAGFWRQNAIASLFWPCMICAGYFEWFKSGPYRQPLMEP